MTGLLSALWVELLKARRSRAPLLTALAIAMFPAVDALFMLILRDPEWARSKGLISAKAQIVAGAADWPAFFSVLLQAAAAGGLVLFGIITIWVFGREYSDRTAKDLLALPVPRESIVAAKFSLVAVWLVVLVVLMYLLGLGLGWLVGLPGWSEQLWGQATGNLALVAGLNILLVTPLAWIASAGRGYLPPVGSMFLILALGQILATLGWGAYFPWSIPALLSGAAGPDQQALDAASYLIVVLTSLVGLAGTLAWWRWADQT